ncbi:MAG TPA: hypothetical protein VMS09_01290 [Paenibacillus sp.]|uniref:putative amidoligase domain-containing protein n=1 Tax=Paenibacillus sp. TaxID=58172 RepID=UPI0028D7ABAF|nr:hypothetical protein [Paenibacillus sp.]HUC90643.1 hypothetical protein [Paenibacillus sp.]
MAGIVWIASTGEKRSAIAKAAALLDWPVAGRDGEPEDGDVVLDAVPAAGRGAKPDGGGTAERSDGLRGEATSGRSEKAKSAPGTGERMAEWEQRGIWVLRGWGSHGGPSDWAEASLRLGRAGFRTGLDEGGFDLPAGLASVRGHPSTSRSTGRSVPIGPAAVGGGAGGAADAAQRRNAADRAVEAAAAAGAGVDEAAGAGAKAVAAAGGEAAKRAPVDAEERSRSNWRFFEVPVFHLEALAIRRTGQGRVPADWSAAHPLYRKLSREAVRAVYALGLDYAAARLAADDEGSIRIVGMRAPVVQETRLWNAAMAAFAAEWRRAVRGEADDSGDRIRAVGDGGHGDGKGNRAAGGGKQTALLIGADPEFVLLRPDGMIASADRFFPPSGAAGTDTVRAGTRLLRPIVELRPDPAEDPGELSRNLWRLLHRAAGLTVGQPLRWLAGAMPVRGVALGGHLHLSGVELNARLLRTLDSLVALPLAAAEDSAGRRRRLRYGALGDFRRQPHGGFEYRTPPSWLVSPMVANAAFALALASARDYRRLTVPELPACDERYRRAYYDGDRELLREACGKTHDSLRRLPSYAALGQWIEPLFTAIRLGATWDESADFRPKWGIPVP